jgi:hypothetical protein
MLPYAHGRCPLRRQASSTATHCSSFAPLEQATVASTIFFNTSRLGSAVIQIQVRTHPPNTQAHSTRTHYTCTYNYTRNRRPHPYRDYQNYTRLWLCLLPLKNTLCKKRFSITSNLRCMKY